MQEDARSWPGHGGPGEKKVVAGEDAVDDLGEHGFAIAQGMPGKVPVPARGGATMTLRAQIRP